MRGIACGTTLAKRACWRRSPSGASKNRWKAWTRPRPASCSNGFKRCRSAKKLGIGCVPYVSLGEEEATGILNLMRASTDKGLGILEQARFVVDLLSIHGMSVAEVAETLSRSKGWVSMRRSLLEEMSPAIQAVLFRGAFPVYSYMYTLRPFMRMNAGQPGTRSSGSCRAVAGRRLSVRDIELLAHAYFRGPASLREAIEGGKLGWSLDQMKNVPEDREGCNEFERGLLRDLEILRKSMQRVMAQVPRPAAAAGPSTPRPTC